MLTILITVLITNSIYVYILIVRFNNSKGFRGNTE